MNEPVCTAAWVFTKLLDKSKAGVKGELSCTQLVELLFLHVLKIYR